MRRTKNAKSKTKRTSPRIDDDCYQKLLAIAQKRSQSLSELTRELYRNLIEQEGFPPNQKPVSS